MLAQFSQGLIIETKEICPVMAIKFRGSISKVDIPKLENCLNELVESQASYFILCFKEVKWIDMRANRLIVQMQNVVRDKKAKLKICLNRVMKEQLMVKGIVRESEVFSSGKNILQDIKKAFESGSV